MVWFFNEKIYDSNVELIIMERVSANQFSLSDETSVKRKIFANRKEY